MTNVGKDGQMILLLPASSLWGDTIIIETLAGDIKYET